MAQGGLKSDPQGVAIRVVSPVDGTYAGIGDTVQVDVIAYAGVSNLDTVIVGLSSSIALADFGDLGFIDTLTAPTSTSKPAVVHQGTSLETFTAKFGIAAGDTETEDATTVVQARVSVEGDDAALKKLDNQSELDMMLGVESFGTVGDGVMIGIDGQRPSGMIDTVYVDTAGVAVFPGETDTRSFKVGSEVRLQLEVTNVPADAEAHIYIVGVGNESDLPDSALVSLAYGFGDLITGELRDSFAVASGDFEDNVRARAVAFVQDGAGNLSASSASSANPEGLQDGLFHVYDGQAPTITAVVPNPDSGRMHFTGMDTSRFDYVEDAGGLTSGKVFDLNPLTFTVGEASVSLRAAGASDTVDFGAKSAGTYSFATMTATDSLGANAVQAGVKMDVTLLAQDSVGNVGNLLLDDVIQDVVSPEPDRVFPRSGDLPGPDARTVNEETRHPLIGL
ncbi:MAG: hypothetical protein QGI83_14885, partial [Candidatus Latescibacteria bacterium]|nr:hypothetical protein [Candidatus Latescibacterota bacterium]